MGSSMMRTNCNKVRKN